jgi:peptidyl-prolyl cis-trans isomerase B (cyclophilin B)
MVRMVPPMRTFHRLAALASLTGALVAADLQRPSPDEVAAAERYVGAVITVEGKGDIHLDLFPKDAPMTVANFAKLAEGGFYDGCTFHRVEPGFVIQGGDPNTRTGEGRPGTGGPGYSIPAEVNRQKHIQGTLAMADSGLNTAGSQFYITLANTPHLDGRYTTFGRIRTPNDFKVVQQVAKGDKMTVRIITAKSGAPPTEDPAPAPADSADPGMR